MRIKLAKKVLEYLAHNKLVALGTSYKNKPWGATVFFAYDTNLNIFFYSRPDTRHCQNIAQNHYVSAVVNQDWGTKGFIKGLQVSGKAAQVSRKNYRRFYALYKKRYPWADRFSSDHVLYEIKPSEIWYIDQKLFGHFYRVRVI